MRKRVVKIQIQGGAIAESLRLAIEFASPGVTAVS
jgi:hypothetical protein